MRVHAVHKPWPLVWLPDDCGLSPDDTEWDDSVDSLAVQQGRQPSSLAERSASAKRLHGKGTAGRTTAKVRQSRTTRNAESLPVEPKLGNVTIFYGAQ
jgi:hypothetical protein